MSKKKAASPGIVHQFENISKPLLDVHSFIKRQIKFTLIALLFLAFCLGIGMLGYHFIAGIGWVGAYHNATMILSGMGEIDHMPSDAARIFSGSYALFSGVVFLSTIAVLFAPVVHRFLHVMHVEDPDA